MDNSQMITLETPSYRKDALNQFIPDGVTANEVCCKVTSVSRSEWSDAGRKGLKAEYRVTVWADEYNGATAAILNGVRYEIYRTYQSSGDEMELYLGRKVGV